MKHLQDSGVCGVIAQKKRCHCAGVVLWELLTWQVGGGEEGGSFVREVRGVGGGGMLLQVGES